MESGYPMYLVLDFTSDIFLYDMEHAHLSPHTMQ